MSIAARLGYKEQLSSIIAITTLNFNILGLIRPYGGGVLLAQFGPIQTLWVTCIGFLPIIFLVRNIKIRPRDFSAKSHQQFRHQHMAWPGTTKKEPIYAIHFWINRLCNYGGSRFALETPSSLQFIDKGPNEPGFSNRQRWWWRKYCIVCKSSRRHSTGWKEVGFLGIAISSLYKSDYFVGIFAGYFSNSRFDCFARVFHHFFAIQCSQRSFS